MSISFVVITCIICLVVVLISLYFKFTQMSFRDLSKKMSKSGMESLIRGTKLEKAINAEASSELDKLFVESRNPWHLSKTMFQLVRFGGLIVGVIIALPVATIDITWAVLPLMGGLLAWWIPKKHYQDEAQANKDIWYEMYSYMWVISQNLMLYNPEATCYNVAAFLRENTNEKELTAAFQEWGDNWEENEISQKIIDKYFCFEIPKQIVKLMFNAQKLGQMDEEDFIAVETYISQEKDQQVEDVIAQVAGKSVLSSTPFVFLSILVGVIFPVLYSMLITLS